MKHYSLVKEHDKHYEIHDARDGKRFKVAKKGIDKKLISKIQKFDVGGTAQGVRPDLPEMPPESPTNLSPQEAGLEAYKQALVPQTDFSSMSPFGARTAASITPAQREILAENAGTAVKNDKEQQQTQVDASTASDAQDLAARNEKRAALGLPLLAGADSGITPASDVVQTPQAPQQVQPQGMQLPGLQDINKALTGEETANTAIGTAQANRAQQEAKAQQDMQTQMESIHSDYKKQFEDNMQKQNDLLNQLNDPKNKIDQNRYWSNMGTGQKIGTILGILIGGGAGPGNNMAANALDQAINRDIDSQKASMDTKNNLLNHYMKQYGNIQQAQSAAKMDLLTVTQSKLNQIAATSNDPISKQQAVLANQKIELEKANLNHQLSMTQAIYGSSDPLTARISLGLQGDQQKEAFKEKGDYEQHQKALQNITGLMKQSIEEESVGNRLMHPIDSYKKAKMLNAGISDALLSTDAAKRLTPEAQKELLKPYEISVTDPKDVKMAKMQGAIQKINLSAPPTPILSGMGWIPAYRGPANFKRK